MKRIFKTLLLVASSYASFGQSIAISTVSPSSCCAGSLLAVSFTTTGFVAGTTFTAQLSDTSGSFVSPVSVGSSVSASGIISGSLSLSQFPGIGYKVRIKASSGQTFTFPTAIAVTYNPLPTITPSAISPTICLGSSTQLISGVARTNFKIDSISYSRIPVPLDANDGPIGDDVTTGYLNLPFSFNFYGPAYTTFNIATNGNLQFGGSDYDNFQAVMFPPTPPITSLTVKNFVALCWGDQILQWQGLANSGAIKYFTYGISPNRRLVVDWDNCAWYNAGNGFFSGQVQLFEGSNIIEFHLRAAMGFACCADSNNYKTMGVLNADATIGDAPPGRNRGLWEVDSTHPEAWRFTPPGNYNYQWTNASSLNNSNTDTVIASPATSTTYNVTAINQFTGCTANGTITVNVTPPATPAVTITSNGTSNPILFTANPVDGGSAPSYNWYVNGVLQSGNGSPIYLNVQNRDTVYCIMMSNANCVTSQTAISNQVGLVLPLTIFDFNASPVGMFTKVAWQTSQEQNTSHFNIQRSRDGRSFDDVGRVAAAGNSSEKRDYLFTDKAPFTGLNYYRLQMLDKDGKFSYSKTVLVHFSLKEKYMVYPNPVGSVLNVQLVSEKTQRQTILITDVQGRTLLQKSFNLQEGVNTFSLNTATLLKGHYIVRIIGETQWHKMIVRE